MATRILVWDYAHGGGFIIVRDLIVFPTSHAQLVQMMLAAMGDYPICVA